MAKFYKRPIFIIGAIILVAVIVGVVLKFTSNDQNNFESVTAIQANLTQRVSVTGNVKPAESIDMSFETSGVIASIDVKVGDKVTAGQTLARLKSAELSADLSQAQANLASRRAMEAQAEASLEAEKNTLADYLKGTRSEEIQIAQTDVNNAQINLTNATENANVALNKLYSEVDGILNEAYTDANDAIGNQIDALFSNDFTDNPKLELTLSNSSLKNSAQDQRAQATNSLEAIRTTIDGLNTTSTSSLDQALTSVRQNLYQVRTLMTTLSSALNYVVGESQANITAYKNDVNTGQININTAINTLDSQIQQISSQKATNNSTIATAENTLKSAQETLNLKQAGYTASQIANQKSAVKQAEANLLSQKAQTRQAEASVSSALAQFEKTILKSPIAGIITNKNSEVGEFIASTQTVFSVISEANYQIEANIPEIDVAKTKLGDEAVVTLDAYGSDREFKAKVINIDPSEKIIEGVPTYKTTFEFTENDNPAKPGMTANLEITTAFRENVISIPQRAVYETENGKTVKVLNSDNSTFREVIVTTGLQGSDGQIEIISGIQVGDKIITSVNTK